jgi:hypothetical protein
MGNRQLPQACCGVLAVNSERSDVRPCWPISATFAAIVFCMFQPMIFPTAFRESKPKAQK